MYYLLSFFIGVIISGLVIYFIFAPKKKYQQKLNLAIQQENESIEQKNIQLKDLNLYLTNTSTELKSDIKSLDNDKQILLQRISDLNNQFTQAMESSKVIHDQAIEIASQNIENSLDILTKEYNDSKEKCKKEYEAIMEENVSYYIKKISELTTEVDNLNSSIDSLRKISDSAIEVFKRAEEIKNKEMFYRLQLSDNDLEEIEKLREVAKLLKDPEPLNKVIWKVYYEKPTTDLIGRVVGSGQHTGIYKITNTQNGMCYVGQSKNLSDRFRQHIKRGLGAEAPTKNKLYPAMMAIGVENFSFEVIEECDNSKLNEQEDYWQEFFHAISFGYSIK